MIALAYWHDDDDEPFAPYDCMLNPHATPGETRRLPELRRHTSGSRRRAGSDGPRLTTGPVPADPADEYRILIYPEG